MTWGAWPVAKPAQILIQTLMGPAKPKGPTEAEIILFSRLGAKSGSVRDEERRWVENALRLDKVVAGDLRTPRTVVESLPVDARLSELRDTKFIHSRIPVIGKDKDNVEGVVFLREVFDRLASDSGSERLRDFMHPLHFVPMSMPAHELLSKFFKERKHMVAVANEYGGFEGFVTLEDVLECFLGVEIVDEHDEHENMQQHAREDRPNSS